MEYFGVWARGSKGNLINLKKLGMIFQTGTRIECDLGVIEYCDSTEEASELLIELFHHIRINKDNLY